MQDEKINVPGIGEIQISEICFISEIKVTTKTGLNGECLISFDILLKGGMVKVGKKKRGGARGPEFQKMKSELEGIKEAIMSKWLGK